MTPGCSAFVLGEGGLLKSLDHAGIKVTDKKPDYMVLGEGHDFSLKKGARGGRHDLQRYAVYRHEPRPFLS